MSKGTPHVVNGKEAALGTNFWVDSCLVCKQGVSSKSLNLFSRRSLQRIALFYGFLKHRSAMELCVNAHNKPFRFKKGSVPAAKRRRITGTVDGVVPGSD